MNDGSVGKLQGDQCTACKYYLISIRLLVKRSDGRGPAEPPPLDKRLCTTLPLAKTLTIYTLTSANPRRSCPEATEGVEKISFDKGWPDHTVQLGCEMEDDVMRALVDLL